MITTTRPLLRYHGGKWRIAPKIVRLFPTHRIYVEPYGGGASVLLRKERSYSEVYNDLDGEIVNLFRVARDHGAELRRRVELTPFARSEFFGAYMKTEDTIDQARRTLVKSHMGFGSNGIHRPTGFRGDCKKRRTIPAHNWATISDALERITERLRGVVIEQTAALGLIKKADTTETLFYVDPPYMAETRNPGHDYRYEMKPEDHAELLAVLAAVRGAVVLSGYACPLYESALAGWLCAT